MRTRSKIVLALVATMAMIAGVAGFAGAQTGFVEDFEDGDVTGWTWAPDGHNGVIEAVTSPTSPSGGDYVGRVSFNSSCYGPAYPFEPATPDYVSWYFRADGDTGHPSGLAVFLRSTDGPFAQISYHQGELRYRSPGGYTPIMAAATGTWYLIELKDIDWDTDTFDIWVDGVERALGASFMTAGVSDIRLVQNYSCPWATGPSYLDDITIGTPVADADGDGVLDGDDACADTVIPDPTIPTNRLGVNRLALVDGDMIFDTTTPPGAPGGQGLHRSYSLADTAGCNAEQIATAMGLGDGHWKFGLSISAMDEWVSLVTPDPVP